MVGILFGVLIFGVLVDKYGRRKIWYILFIGFVIFGFVSLFVSIYRIYVLFRFLIGFFIGGEILLVFVLVIELIGFLYRGFVGIMV